MSLTEEQRAALKRVAAYITVEPTGGFDLEKARAADEALPYPLDANEIWVSGKGQMHINPPNAPSIFFTLSDLCEFRNLFHGQAAEIERLRPFEIAARYLDSDLTKIAGERDDQAARIKELESSLGEAEALTKKNAELMNGYLGRIKVLEKNCIYDPGDGKIFVPDGHPEIERLRARVVALEDALAEYQRLGKIISEFAVIPCLTVHGNCDQCRPKTKAACEAIAAIHKGKIGSGGGA